MKVPALVSKLNNCDAHHRLLIATAAAGLIAVGLAGHVSARVHIFVSWDCFSGCILALAWLRIISADPQKVRRTASLQDSSRTLIFVFVVISACASLLALGFVMGSAKELTRGKLAEHVLLSVSTVACSWLLVHTMFALRYAHLFYSATTSSSEDYAGGLQFPEEKAPDYLDFAYFSFVVGMTCQVSDVQITSRSIRRLALAQGILSFAFNTVILALTVNIISGLLQ